MRGVVAELTIIHFLGLEYVAFKFSFLCCFLGGYFCPERSTNSQAQNCRAGYYCEEATTEEVPCTRGHYCPELSSTPTECLVGTFQNELGKDSNSDCKPCVARLFAHLLTARCCCVRPIYLKRGGTCSGVQSVAGNQ